MVLACDLRYYFHLLYSALVSAALSFPPDSQWHPHPPHRLLSLLPTLQTAHTPEFLK